MKVYLKELKAKFTKLTGVVARAKEVRAYLTNLELSHLYNHLDFRRKSTWFKLMREVEWTPQRLLAQVHESYIVDSLINFPVSCRHWLFGFYSYITRGHDVSSDDPEIIKLYYPNWKPDPNRAEYLANLKKRIFSLNIGKVIKLLVIGDEGLPLPNCPIATDLDYIDSPMISMPWAPRRKGWAYGYDPDKDDFLDF